MSRQRKDITHAVEDTIREELMDGATVQGTSLKYSCSEGLIRTIRTGTRNSSFLDAVKAPAQDVVMCSACGERPKDPDLRKLCRQCFQENSE